MSCDTIAEIYLKKIIMIETLLQTKLFFLSFPTCELIWSYTMEPYATFLNKIVGSGHGFQHGCSTLYLLKIQGSFWHFKFETTLIYKNPFISFVIHDSNMCRDYLKTKLKTNTEKYYDEEYIRLFDNISKIAWKTTV